MAGRFIKLYDKILKWEWYRDTNTFRLFMHLLLKANYKDVSFKGHKILRGQLVTSLTSLSADTSLSVRQVRDSLEHLKMTGEVTSKAYSKYRVITIVRYDEYQSNDKQNDSQVTSRTAGKRQADDKQIDKQTVKQMTSEMTTSIDNIEDIERVEKIERIEREGKTTKRFSPPSLEEVSSYIREMGSSIDPQHFVDYYAARGWELKPGQKVKDWKACVRTWMQREKKGSQEQAAPRRPVIATQYEQRDYSGQSEDLDAMLDFLAANRG